MLKYALWLPLRKVCALSKTIFYVLLACPTNLAVRPSPSSVLVNTTLKCSSKDAPSSTTYYWLNGTRVVSLDAMVTVSEPGPFFLTCVANTSAVDRIHCVKTLNVSGTALGLSNRATLYTE